MMGLDFSRGLWARPNASTERLEVSTVRRCGRFGGCALQEQVVQMQTVMVLADQLAHGFAAGAMAALADLLVHEGRERVVHGSAR